MPSKLWILEPHDGEFGIGFWVSCQAPTCLTRDPAVAGSFAIRVHEAHYIDTQRYQHVHKACGQHMVAEGLAVWKEAETENARARQEQEAECFMPRKSA